MQRMRAWRDKDGSFLVEFEGSSGKSFAQMATSGTVTGVFEPRGSSDAEYLYHYTYEVEGGTLVEHVHMEVDTGRESRWVNVVRHGLSPLTGAELPFSAMAAPEAAARFKQEQNRRVWAEQKDREAQRPRSLHHFRTCGKRRPSRSSCSRKATTSWHALARTISGESRESDGPTAGRTRCATCCRNATALASAAWFPVSGGTRADGSVTVRILKFR
jgi:hypothetical protein